MNAEIKNVYMQNVLTYTVYLPIKKIKENKFISILIVNLHSFQIFRKTSQIKVIAKM